VIVAAAAVALAVVLLDATSVAVLLPTIRLDLGSSSSGAAWVMTAHLLAFAALLPVVACLGRGRAFPVAGALLMAAGAVVCATADSTSVLVTGRALHGAGAAAVLGALTGDRFPPAAPTLALPALTLALGPLVGGAFAELNWWHVFFWAGVPLAAVAALPAIVAQGPTRVEVAPELPRRLALAAGLTAIAVALIQSEDWSAIWWVLLLFGGAVGIRVARLPRPGPLAAAAALACGCLAALAFLMPEYFELVRRLSGLRSGLLLLAVTVPAVAGWAAVRSLRAQLPEQPVTIVAALCVAAGLGVLVTLAPDTPYVLALGALVLVGSGLGLAVGATRRGDEPALVVGWAAAGAMLVLAAAAKAFEHMQAEERSDGASFEEALSSGIGGAATMLLLVLVTAAVLIWLTRPTSSAAPPAAASSPPPRHPA
jgi:MFS family permease